jgi:hypothetical protein
MKVEENSQQTVACAEDALLKIISMNRGSIEADLSHLPTIWFCTASSRCWPNIVGLFERYKMPVTTLRRERCNR